MEIYTGWAGSGIETWGTRTTPREMLTRAPRPRERDRRYCWFLAKLCARESRDDEEWPNFSRRRRRDFKTGRKRFESVFL